MESSDQNREGEQSAKMAEGQLDVGLFRDLFNYLAQPIFVKDHQHRIIYANTAFFDIFKTDESQVIGFTLAEAVPEHEREHFLSVDRKVLDTGLDDLREEELTVDGQTKIIVTSKRRYINEAGEYFLIGSIHDITELRSAERELKAEKERLVEALAEIKTLRGIIPICSYCKKIRDDEGYWQQIEEYVSEHSEALFSHGICRQCSHKWFPELDLGS